MYRTITAHRVSSGNDANIYELDRISRFVAEKTGSEVFEWGRIINAFAMLYMDKTHVGPPLYYISIPPCNTILTLPRLHVDQRAGYGEICCLTTFPGALALQSRVETVSGVGASAMMTSSNGVDDDEYFVQKSHSFHFAHL